MSQSKQRKKIVNIDSRAYKELLRFPKEVQFEFVSLKKYLEKTGRLEPPVAKKITKNLFELRVKKQGAWRGLYAYILNNKIIILHFFRKKTQSLPLKELHTAERRLQQYI